LVKKKGKKKQQKGIYTFYKIIRP